MYSNTNMKPVILTVDDDPQVLRSVERDLRSKYGNGFRVLRADSGLEILKQLKLRNEPPASRPEDAKYDRCRATRTSYDYISRC
jgi:CheY-like chemotaxis protein